MNNDIIKAKEILDKENATCVFCRDESVIISHKRGVNPLIELIESGENYSRFSVADKVVGNGAAFLYVILNIREIFAKVISDAACDTFNKYGISYMYENRVKSIQNRTNTGICPMEQAVMNAKTPDEAFMFIKKKIEELKSVK